MGTIDLIAIGLVVIGFGLVSGRLEGSPITPPMVFVAAGVALGAGGLFDVGIEDPLVGGVMEATLVIVLFTDASRIDLSALRMELSAPVRMLSIGLTLTVLAGAVIGLVLLPSLGIWEVAVLAVALAPTDAALGQAVVSDPSVPRRVRQTLNVESGLNDGLALPLLTIVIAFAGTAEATNSAGFWTRFALQEIGVAVGVGIAIGWITAKAIVAARSRGWMTGIFLKLSGVSVALLAFALTNQLDGSGFIAAFVAGAVLGTVARTECTPIHAFAEAEGQLLVLVTFLLFGAIAVGPAFERLDWRIVTYALLSLTAVRMIPVALSLMGSGLRPVTVWFLAWFGPRGLASILFGLIVLESTGITSNELIFDVIVITVTASALLHGLTAAPLATRYGRRVESTMTDEMAEMGDVVYMPTRLPWQT